MARANDDDHGPSWGALLLVGMVAGVSLGAVITLLLRERGRGQLLEGSGGGGQPINIYNISGDGQARAQAMAQRFLVSGS